MRIALLLPGGAGQVNEGIHVPALFQLVSKLSDDVDVTVYSPRVSSSSPRQGRCGNAVVHSMSFDRTTHWTRKLLGYSRAISHDHAERPYDIIQAMMGVPEELSAVVIGKRLNIPSVVSFLGGETANVPQVGYGLFRHKSSRWLILWIARRARALTVLSEFQKEILRAHGLHRADIEVVPHGVDGSVFSSNGKALSPPFNLLSVANIHKLKDHETLLKAFSIVHQRLPSRLRIIGIDFRNGRIQQLARELEIAEHVEFRGFVSYEEMPMHYRWAHMLLHTSMYEGGCMAAVEAASSGVVLAGTSVGFFSDCSPDKALACEVGNFEQLADDVCRVLRDEAAYRSLQALAHRWASEHDISWTVDRYKKIYLRAANSALTDA
jgi:glycosyltransferase involved in cell wall biosynthesis